MLFEIINQETPALLRHHQFTRQKMLSTGFPKEDHDNYLKTFIRLVIQILKQCFITLPELRDHNPDEARHWRAKCLI